MRTALLGQAACAQDRAGAKVAKDAAKDKAAVATSFRREGDVRRMVMVCFLFYQG
jgi:hypothetical protein